MKLWVSVCVCVCGELPTHLLGVLIVVNVNVFLMLHCENVTSESLKLNDGPRPVTCLSLSVRG